jgi:hypothetical protein
LPKISSNNHRPEFVCTYSLAGEGFCMDLNFIIQSTLPRRVVGLTGQVSARRTALVRPLTGAGWFVYFASNARRCRRIPWEAGAGITPAELVPIRRSLQAWQRGETSDGRHLRAAAVSYAARIGDGDYPAAVELFIREEQRHGLGRFLDLAGAGRRTFDWGDLLFRAARYGLAGMEAWTTPVVMVETLPLVYYQAIRRASGSPVLQFIRSTGGISSAPESPARGQVGVVAEAAGAAQGVDDRHGLPSGPSKLKSLTLPSAMCQSRAVRFCFAPPQTGGPAPSRAARVHNSRFP